MFKSLTRYGLFAAVMIVGALALTACGGAASSAAAKPVNVQVTLTDFKIDSSQTTFSVGVPYHFIVTNKGSVSHQFLISASEDGQLTEQQALQKALAEIDTQDLPAGATKTLDYTFTQTAPAGQLEFSCHVAGHYEAGMRTPIEVK